MHSRNNPVELLKRAAKSRNGLSHRDYRDFRILFAKGFDRKIYAVLPNRIAAR